MFSGGIKWKRWTEMSFLTFSEGIGMWNWTKMGYCEDLSHIEISPLSCTAISLTGFILMGAPRI